MSRKKVSPEIWEQARIAIASGSIGLRALARNMGIPEDTVLARAKREGWTKMIEAAKHATEGGQSGAITPTVLQSVAASMQERAVRYTERMAGVSEKVPPHLESMEAAEILGNARDVEQYDRFSRRNFGLESQPPAGGSINLAILTNQAAVQLVSKPA